MTYVKLWYMVEFCLSRFVGGCVANKINWYGCLW